MSSILKTQKHHFSYSASKTCPSPPLPPGVIFTSPATFSQLPLLFPLCLPGLLWLDCFKCGSWISLLSIFSPVNILFSSKALKQSVYDYFKISINLVLFWDSKFISIYHLLCNMSKNELWGYFCPPNKTNKKPNLLTVVPILVDRDSTFLVVWVWSSSLDSPNSHPFSPSATLLALSLK